MTQIVDVAEVLKGIEILKRLIEKNIGRPVTNLPVNNLPVKNLPVKRTGNSKNNKPQLTRYKIEEQKIDDGKKRIHNWSFGENIIALYNYLFGINNIRNYVKTVEELSNKYVGSTGNSIIMQGENLHNLLDIKRKKGINFLIKYKNPKFFAKDGGVGLADYSFTQKDVVIKYGDYSEPDLRKVVIDIFNNTDTKQNMRLARKRKVHRQDNKLKKYSYKNN